MYTKHDVIHYCVPNLPSRVARTASIAMSNILSPIILELGNSGGVKSLLKEKNGVRNSVYIYNGILTNEYIGSRFGIPSKDINLLMARITSYNVCYTKLLRTYPMGDCASALLEQKFPE